MMRTREQIDALLNNMPDAELESVLEILRSRLANEYDPEAAKPGDLVDDWGNLSALRRASPPRWLDDMAEGEIAANGETIGEAMGRPGGPTPTPTTRRGEVWWYEHPYMKPRPALLMNRDETAGDPDELFVVLLTTIGGLPGEVKLGTSDGMPRACALLVDQIDVADKSHLGARITMLDEAKMSEASGALMDVHV
jgi:mRNA-degrading endonuclease toxin of MazEF toxin-antitoxin module